MIEGTQGFHFLGLSTCDRGAMLMFQEGMLVLDVALPGWGVMPQTELKRLFPAVELRARSGRSGDSGDSPRRQPTAADLAIAEFMSLSSDTDTPGNTPDNSPSLSPITSSDDESEPEWAPPQTWLGWWPSEAPLRVGRVTREALKTYHRSVSDAVTIKSLAEDFRAGRLTPPALQDRQDGVMVELKLFGLLRLLAWAGIWMPADHPELNRGAFTAERIAALVAHARVAGHCNLAEVPEIDNCEYLGHVEDQQSRVLVFDNGLLVQRHPEGWLEGWHPMGEAGHWSVVAPDIGDVLAELCENQADVRGQDMVQDFFDGAWDDAAGTRFVALAHSARRHRWLSMQLEAPHGLQLPGAPNTPTAAELQRARNEARLAAVHNWQTAHSPDSLLPGAWNVPMLVGAVRFVLGSHSVPGLLQPTWHATLQPLIERQLLAHRALEQKWLADGVIRQPIDSLIDLMRRDRRMRRPEVSVMWPVTQMDELFKSLAPQVPVRVTPLPRVEEVQTALARKAGRLLVFKALARPVQSVAVAVFDQCWTEEGWSDLGWLQQRVRRCFGPGATERLVALATID